MITDKDITKLKKTFVTKQDLKRELKRELAAFATKEELSITVRELISFIGERFETLSEQMIEFKNEMSVFRTEMRDINRTHRSTLDNHEVRLSRIEYVSK